MKIVGKMCSIDYFVIPRYQAQKLSSRDIQGTGLVHCSSFSPAPIEDVTRHSDTTSGLGMMGQHITPALVEITKPIVRL